MKQIIDFLNFSLGGEICPAPNSGINHHQYDKPNGYANDKMGNPIQNIGNNGKGDSEQAEMRTGLLCQAPPVNLPYHRSGAYNRTGHTKLLDTS